MYYKGDERTCKDIWGLQNRILRQIQNWLLEEKKEGIKAEGGAWTVVLGDINFIF